MKFYNSTSLTVPQILNSKEYSLVSIKKNEGETFVIAFLIKMINHAISSFNVTNSMNGIQVTQVARSILKMYWGYKISDFKLCFDRAKNGFYGTNFNRIDQEIVMGWIHSYSIERDEEIALIRQTESNDKKADAKSFSNEVTEVILPILKNSVERISINEKKQDSKSLSARTETDKLANKWMSQFDKYHDKKQIVKGGIRFIRRYGKLMDLTEFLDYKLSQYNGFAHMKPKKPNK